MRLLVCKANNNLHLLDGRLWLVFELENDEVTRELARFASHNTALSFSLWKVGLAPNYGGALL